LSPGGALASLLPDTGDWQEMVAAVTQLFMSLRTQVGRQGGEGLRLRGDTQPQ
jgi:hypothetical protein